MTKKDLDKFIQDVANRCGGIEPEFVSVEKYFYTLRELKKKYEN